MSKGKTLIIVNYIILLLWWVILLISGHTEGLGNSLFNLGMGIYVFVLSISLAISSYKHTQYLPHKVPVIITSIGLAFFGLGTIFWFYYDAVFGINIPFPSISDLFYVLQPPFTVLGMLLFLRKRAELGIIFKFSNIKHDIVYTFIFVYLVLVLALITSYTFTSKIFDLDHVLLFYYPLESFSVLALTFITYIKYLNSWMNSVSIWIVVMLIGSVSWFGADSLFLYGILTNTFFNASIADLLFATGSFFFLLGLIGIIEGSRKDGFISPVGSIYYQKVETYVPTSLNLREVDADLTA